MEARGDRRPGGAIATGSVTAGVTLMMLERTWGARGLGERIYRPVAACRLIAAGSSASKLGEAVSD
jgi:hypothetical protein